MEVINKVFQYKNKKHLLKQHVPEVVEQPPPKVEQPPSKVDQTEIRELQQAKKIVEEIQEQHKIPLFLREDYIYTEKKDTRTYNENDRNPFKSVHHKYQMQKDQLQELEHNLDNIDF